MYTNQLKLSPYSLNSKLVYLFSSTLLLLILQCSMCLAPIVRAQIYYPPATSYPPTSTYPYPSGTYPYNSGSYLCPYPTPYSNNVYPYPGNTYPYNSNNLCTPGQNPFPGLISSQPVSPWFPSIPAVACGGNLFSFTIQGKPHMDVKLVSDNSKQDQKKGLLALQIISANNGIQIISANNGIFLTKNSVTGMIFQGASNIEHNKGHDFDVKTMFNDCQTLAFSK
jgi:hypothetical protein